MIDFLFRAQVGHHAQEDFPEEVAAAIKTSLKRPLLA
jgi:hypothetical protein